MSNDDTEARCATPLARCSHIRAYPLHPAQPSLDHMGGLPGGCAALLLTAALLAGLQSGSSGRTPRAAATPRPAANVTKYTCNTTLGECVECPPPDPEQPPYAQKCLKFTLGNITKCDLTCHKPTPKDHFWICNTETHKCESGPFQPHFSTENECNQKCAATEPMGYTCKQEHGHAKCARTRGGEHKTIGVNFIAFL